MAGLDNMKPENLRWALDQAAAKIVEQKAEIKALRVEKASLVATVESIVDEHVNAEAEINELAAKLEAVEFERDQLKAALDKARGELFDADTALITVQEHLMQETEPQRFRMN